jgi:hypothetical protein
MLRAGRARLRTPPSSCPWRQGNEIVENISFIRRWKWLFLMPVIVFLAPRSRVISARCSNRRQK